jgi:hypothetical protein
MSLRHIAACCILICSATTCLSQAQTNVETVHVLPQKNNDYLINPGRFP